MEKRNLLYKDSGRLDNAGQGKVIATVTSITLENTEVECRYEYRVCYLHVMRLVLHTIKGTYREAHDTESWSKCIRISENRNLVLCSLLIRHV